MPQQITTPEQKQAQASLEQLRRAIADFHMARLATNEALSGMRVVRAADGSVRHPSDLAATVAAGRDSTAEQDAVNQLRDLLRLIYQREPTQEEMRITVPPTESLGIVWLAPIALTAVIGGSASLTSLFSYLAERERRVQAQLGIRPAKGWPDVLSEWRVPIIAGAVAVGGWYIWKHYGAPIKEWWATPSSAASDEHAGGVE